MDLQLADRVVLVAGAGGAIGTAITQTFAAEGARVIAAARVAAATPSSHIDQQTADLENLDAVVALVRHTERTYARVDVLVNNVGPIELHPGGYLSVDDADLRQVLDTNLVVAARVCRAVLPGMVEKRSGSIVNLASITATEPVAALAHYSAAKAALVNLGLELAREFGPYGIKINTVSPTPVRSPGHEPVLDLRYATGRPNTADEVAALVAFVASAAVPNLTGGNHIIDGGLLGA